MIELSQHALQEGVWVSHSLISDPDGGGAFHGIIIRFILILSQSGQLQKQDKIIK